MAKVKSLHAREILDSRGFPTVEVEIELEGGFRGRAAVPSGASTGAHEAIELRDKDAKRYHGKGVLTAVENVKTHLAKAVVNGSFSEQKLFDQALLEVDGTANKSKMGANGILGASLAFAKSMAAKSGLPLYKYLGSKSYRLPVPLMNVLNGGAHANNGLEIQEFMIVPVGAPKFSEALRMGSEIFHKLKSILNEKGLSTAVGDEGGFAPHLKGNEEALKLLCSAIEKSGYRLGEDVFLALDVASTEFFNDGVYKFEGKKLKPEALGEIYASWIKKYPLVSIEDGFAEDDWQGWQAFNKSQGEKLQLVGDDLFVTNPQRLKRGIEEKSANAILVKVNQIGSLSETIQAVGLAKENKFATVMSHRSGETEDVTIADLAVALDCQQIKTGSLCRTDRVAKYNQLLRIEEELGKSAVYWGASGFRQLH